VEGNGRSSLRAAAASRPGAVVLSCYRTVVVRQGRCSGRSMSGSPESAHRGASHTPDSSFWISWSVVCGLLVC